MSTKNGQNTEAFAAVATAVDADTLAVYAPDRAEGASDIDYALGAAIRRLRDQGTAWWRAAYELGLPGTADSLPAGKPGGPLARKLYARAFGEAPRRAPAEGGTRTREPGAPRARRSGKKRNSAEVVQARKPVFGDDTTDAVICESVAGKRIKWSLYMEFDGQGQPLTKDQEATVGRKNVRIERNHCGRRTLCFNEVHETDDPRMARGPMRSVYVDRIFAVGR